MLRLSFSDGKQEPVDLDRRRLTIGRDQANDVVLDDGRVSGFHAEIQTEGGKSFVVDLGSTNGTLVGGIRISGRHELKAWERISFGGVEAELVDPDERRPTQVHKAVGDAASEATWSMVGISQPLEGKVFPLSGPTVVGRDKACEVVISLATVSGRHAEIAPSREGLTVRDLGSTNGTFVNEIKIQGPTVLRDGDEVKFDEAVFRVVGPGEAADKTKVRPGLDLDKTMIRKASNATRVVPEIASALEGAGSQAGRRFTLSGVNITVGRTPENDIAIDDATVSAAHARLASVAGGWQVEDLGSSNGTFINGKRIKSQVLANGDTIRFGMAEFLYDEGSRKAPGTAQMPLSESETRTSTMPLAKNPIPSWAYGVMGFIIVTAAFLAFMQFRKEAPDPMETAKLQGGVAWSRHLGEGRGAPTTPLISDVNGDGMLDVIVADSAGFVLALDGEKGLMIFEAEAPDRILAPPIAADLTGDGVPDLIVAGSTGRVTAFNGKGQVLWTSAANLNLGEILNRPVAVDLTGNGNPDLVIPTANRGLVALDGSRGWELWNTGEMIKGRLNAAPLMGDINGDGLINFVAAAENGHVVALTTREGKVWKLWENRLPKLHYASPVLVRVDKRTLVVIATDGHGVVALDGENGRPAWNVGMGKRFFASPVAVDANGDGSEDVVVIGENGDIHVLDGRTGDEIWSMALGVSVQASPALFDFTLDGLKDLIILDGRGTLHCVNMERGRVNLSMPIPGADGFLASPLLADVNGDGLVNVITAAKNGQVNVLFLNRRVGRDSKPWPVFMGR